MKNNSNPTSLNSQLELFDSIYEEYVSSYSNNSAISESIVWLLDKLRPNSKVLDIGCGTAEQTAPEFLKSNHSFTGVDSSNEMLKIARKNNPNAEFSQVDFSDLKLDDEFDAIISYFSLLMLPKDKIISTLRSFVDMVKNEGFVIIAMIEGDFDFIEIPFFNKKAFVSAYKTEDFKAILEKLSLKVIKAEEHTFAPQNGGVVEVQQFFYCQKRVE